MNSFSHIDFINDRLDHMASHPGMWATTKESFGVQVLLLIDLHLAIERDYQHKGKICSMDKLVWGVGPSVPTDPISDAWALDVVGNIKRELSVHRGAYHKAINKACAASTLEHALAEVAAWETDRILECQQSDKPWDSRFLFLFKETMRQYKQQ